MRLTGCLRESDTVARLGGDEFVLVLNDHSHTSTVISLLERVLQEISRPVVLSGREFQVGASLGVALYPDDAANRHTERPAFGSHTRPSNPAPNCAGPCARLINCCLSKWS